MTAEPSLFERIRSKGSYYPPKIGSPGGYFISRNNLQMICTEYEQRLADLNRNNEILASRLKKLMEKK